MDPQYNGEQSFKRVLRLRRELEEAFDGSWLDPSKIGSLSVDELKRLPVAQGTKRLTVGDLFHIEGPVSEEVEVHGDLCRMHRIGYRMQGGTLRVVGNAGSGLGESMSGGCIEVSGNVGDGLATGMRGGFLFVEGSAGDRVAGPVVGGRRGMSGGDLVIRGSVGDFLAERMRRGTIWVGGNAGDQGAVQMIAGTLAIMGSLGTGWGMGMRRGSIILNVDSPKSFDALLTRDHEYELSFLPILWRHLQHLMAGRPLFIPTTRWATRRLGDRSNGGVGEILTLSRPSRG